LRDIARLHIDYRTTIPEHGRRRFRSSRMQVSQGDEALHSSGIFCQRRRDGRGHGASRCVAVITADENPSPQRKDAVRPAGET
jgi:hypothetical protein